MKQIDIKKPKYIIPLIILPFILGLGYVIQDMVSSQTQKQETILAETEDMNLEIPDANLEKKDIKSKLGALQGAFSKSSDYSSIQTIDKEVGVNEVEDGGSLYTSDEMRKIDSLNQASRLKEMELLAQQEKYREGNLSNTGEPDRGGNREAPKKSKMQEEMELFKMQMAYIDSIQNPRPKQQPVIEEVAKEKEPIADVVKAENPAMKYFNTVGKEEKSSLISAILDETVKVTSGSRIRIRLLDDIMIDKVMLTKGTYIYGNVAGFKEQRVNIKVSSIMVNGKQMKVDLNVYDNDGQEGFFVPASAFRDLTKQVGGQLGSQNIQFSSQAEGIEQFAYGALQDAYRSTTQAISKNIKKNKAKLKYNTQVFLVNNNEKNK